LDFAGWPFGQFGEEMDAVGGFELAQTLLAQVDQRGLREGGAGLYANGSLDRFAVAFAWAGEGRSLDDVGLGIEDLVDFAGRDVFAAFDD